MKLIIILFFFSMLVYSQNNSINCDSLFYLYSQNIGRDKVPELIGGMDSLLSRLIYPENARGNKIEGKVYILAIIDEAGNVACIKVIKGLGYGCDEEALRLIKTSSFYPALLRNKPVTCILAIPIVFSLNSN